MPGHAQSSLGVCRSPIRRGSYAPPVAAKLHTPEGSFVVGFLEDGESSWKRDEAGKTGQNGVTMARSAFREAFSKGL